MTQKLFYQKGRIALLSLLLLLLAFMLVKINTVTDAVTDGLLLSVQVILPSLFPFLILSNLMSDCIPYSGRQHRSLFSSVFRLPRVAITPLLLGFLSGFPIGAKSTARLYERGVLQKEEAERLLLFANNTGPAFLVGGIGGLFFDAHVGLVLFIIQLLTALLFGMLMAFGKPPVINEPPIDSSDNAPSFVRAVRDAVMSSVQIVGFVTAFRVILALFSVLLAGKIPQILLSLLLEVGNAAVSVSALSSLPYTVTLPLLAFAVSFSGLSVYAQTRALLQKSGLSFRLYLPAKLFQGLLSAGLAYLAATFIF